MRSRLSIDLLKVTNTKAAPCTVVSGYFSIRRLRDGAAGAGRERLGDAHLLTSSRPRRRSICLPDNTRQVRTSLSTMKNGMIDRQREISRGIRSYRALELKSSRDDPATAKKLRPQRRRTSNSFPA